jgi:hypothetical protein
LLPAVIGENAVHLLLMGNVMVSPMRSRGRLDEQIDEQESDQCRHDTRTIHGVPRLPVDEN